MQVFVNNKENNLNSGANLLQLLSMLDMVQKRGIAVAVNNTIVQSAAWETMELKENDRIIIIRPTQGG